MRGGVMRTAAKVGISSGAAAVRFRHAPLAFATAPSAEAAAAPLVSVAGAGEAPVAAGAQWAPLEVDDWEFADWRDAAEAEVVKKSRLVFAPPTREEAEDATSDLTDAIKSLSKVPDRDKRSIMARETASTCELERVQGTHRFKIVGYNSFKASLGTGKFVRSCNFDVGGYDWTIKYFPNGDSSASEGYISVFLELMSKSCEVSALIAVGLVDQVTGLAKLLGKGDALFNSTKRRCWGYSKFKPRSELEASGYVRDDRLTIECTFTIVKEPRASASKPFSETEVPPTNIWERVGKLWETKEGVDVSFSVQGEAFTAHRMMLAACSPVLKAELYGPMKEKDTPCIAIDDMQPAVFRALLHFIYTDSLPTMDDLDGDDCREMIRCLLVAADRYAIRRLKRLCECRLARCLQVETVATTLALADQHHCDMLKDACIEFIASTDTKGKVVATEDYKQLKRNCPSILVDLWEKINNHVFRLFSESAVSSSSAQPSN